MTEVGVATIRFEGATAQFTTTVHGFTQTKTISRQPFGTAIANKPPQVTLAVSSQADPPTAPASFTLEAAASDLDGRVTKVSFYKDYDQVGETTAPPYRMVVAGVEAGKHRFSARASDDKGATALATSTIRTVKGGSGTGTASNKLPKVALTSPAANTFFAPGASVAFSATASDPDGTVAKVEFFANTTQGRRGRGGPVERHLGRRVAGLLQRRRRGDRRQGRHRRPRRSSRSSWPPRPRRRRGAPAMPRASSPRPRSASSRVAEIDALASGGYEAWLSSAVRA